MYKSTCINLNYVRIQLLPIFYICTDFEHRMQFTKLKRSKFSLFHFFVLFLCFDGISVSESTSQKSLHQNNCDCSAEFQLKKHHNDYNYYKRIQAYYIYVPDYNIVIFTAAFLLLKKLRSKKKEN